MSSQQQFQAYQEALKTTGRSIPRLIIDLDILDRNITSLLKMVAPEMPLRLVVKSLPSIGLINYLRTHLRTDRLMIFHQPFLSAISDHLAKTPSEGADILLGKPMPVDTAAYFYRQAAPTEAFNPYTQVQWLVDTVERIREYLNLADQLGCGHAVPALNLNLEIDIGLHRGGFSDLGQLNTALKLLAAHRKALRLSGLMGYDPHLVKIPRLLRSRKKLQKAANTFYQDCKALIQNDYPDLWHEGLTFNGAGSPTLALHQQESPLSEVAAGSALVKPTTFDIPTLSHMDPACFIATPVLKRFNQTRIPGLEFLPNNKPSCFIYGGFWKATYHFPKGSQENKLFGASTNQSLVDLPKGSKVSIGDYIFLRPQQSEFVMLQFGDILAIRGNKVVDEWAVLPN